MKNISLFLLFLFVLNFAQAQKKHNTYTHADTLRGSLRPERTNYDVLKYDLSVEVFPDKKFISGHNKISFKVLHNLPVMQLDLFKNMQVDSIIFKGQKLSYKRDANAVFIHFSSALKKGTKEALIFYYSGHPKIAKKPPWDGGFIFTKDHNQKDWISVAVQGIGASLWYPCKDTQSDEPESAEIHVTTPKGLMDVSNGRLIDKKTLNNGKITWSWKVENPINNYNLVLNIGDYVHFSDKFKDLDLDYYVLPYNKRRAQVVFKRQVQPMLKCFTKKFGDYPFKKDGYKLVETPYLGMEHQSAIGYGNNYKRGYKDTDLSGTRIGLKWDFIIVHESAHEWFGNSITASDIADMWIHESFASYAEAVYVECRWGKNDALTYLSGLRKTMVKNDRPIIGDYGVNSEGSADMYYKGANMLHTLRSIVDDDKTWWALIKNFSLHFKHKITNTKEVVAYFDQHIDKDFDVKAFFDQYLRYKDLPLLEFKIDKGHLVYRWEAGAVGFDMPIDVDIKGTKKRLYPSKYWQKFEGDIHFIDIKIDTKNFFVNVKSYGIH